MWLNLIRIGSKFYMMLRLILAIFFMSFSKLMALEFACNFEGYTDGQTQQGTVLFQNENIRYEYR